MYIPAYSATVPWSANILADIGDGQSLALSLSAFTSRLARFKAILDESGRLALSAAQNGGYSDTVVLLDELVIHLSVCPSLYGIFGNVQKQTLYCVPPSFAPSLQGTGTNPAEGAAIGEAILRALEPLAALVVCTSHAARLALLKYDSTSLAPAAENPSNGISTEQRESSPFEAAAAELDEDLAPTYRLLWGVPGTA